MPKNGSKTGKGGKSSKTARVLSLLTDPASLSGDHAAEEPTVQRLDDKATQEQIRDALVEELFGSRKPARGGKKAVAEEEPPESQEPSVPEFTPIAPETPAPAAPQAAPTAPAPVVTQAAPTAPAPVAPQAAPMASAPVVTQAAPMASAPVAPQAAPAAPAPAAPQAAPVVPAPAAPQAAPVAPAPAAPQTAPVAPAPAAPQAAPAAPAPAAPQAAKKPEPHPDEFICYNLTQALVEAKAEKYMKLMGMCTCNRCKVDVTAIALSNLPSKYVATSNRDVMPLLSMYEGRYSAAVTTQVMNACEKVKLRPHHKR